MTKEDLNYIGAVFIVGVLVPLVVLCGPDFVRWLF